VEETVTVVVQDSTQTFTETLPLEPVSTETLVTEAGAAAEAVAHPDAVPRAGAEETAEVVSSEAAEVLPTALSETPVSAQVAPEATGELQPDLKEPESVAETDMAEILDPAPNSLADQLLEAEPEVLDVAQQVAYEAFLKDTSESFGGQGIEPEDDSPVELPGSAEPVAKIDESGELQIEMDTKNAHVWNELGNVYFNTSAFDDAIVAYSKAIELDRWFAWPYSNLALAYVQKRRFVEAILLYQRSIELFSTDKDKAISWNRLGNVYRRLNDYENAIAAYQRADALDPDNSTLSLQSRFSLLGNYAMEQKPSYVS
jgi:tetratricopeptide (TPR) repeat protein